MKLKTTLGVCLLASAALIPAFESARAYVASPCNGKVLGGIHANHTFRIDRCHTPANNAAENAVLTYGRDEWNKVSGMHNRFLLAEGDNNCAMVPDNTSEIGLVPANHPELVAAGASGLATSLSYTCVAPYDSTHNGRTYSVDVLVSQAELGVLDALDLRQGARQILLHEFGHVLGMKHETAEAALMNRAVVGKFGAHSVAGVASGRAEMYFPDELQMVSTYHSDGGAGVIDPAVSAWQWSTAVNPAAVSRIYLNPTVNRYCRGATVSVRMTNANLGKADIPQASPITMRIVFSQDLVISNADRTAHEFTFWGTRGFFGTSTKTFTIPANMPTGLYNVGVIADPGQLRAEHDEGNNATLLGLPLVVDC